MKVRIPTATSPKRNSARKRFVMNKILSVLWVLLLAECFLGSIAIAQSNSCVASVQSCIYSDPNNPNGIIVSPPVPPHRDQCVTTGPGCAICTTAIYACPPPNAANEVCPFCNGGRTAQSSPIDLATGNVYVSQADISVPGLGGGLSLARTWNSLAPSIQSSFPSMFGSNWRSTYEERIIFNSGDGYVKYARADGSVWSFGFSSADTQLTFKTAAPRNDGSTLITGTNYYTLTAKSGEKRLFDNTTGALLSIIDRNGNTTQLTYDTSNRLVTVADPAGRHLYFGYASGSSSLVTAVTSDIGFTMSYSYDAQGRLAQVTKPDTTTVSFTYDAQSRITAVKDPDGKVLESHTYDAAGRGLSSSRANGVGSVTVTYPQ
jgi:YD repeat-containing protein